ncbi:MAG TPA: CPBP family glutamic-type intramembrane protease [Planctomycetota bacterium]|nr:CPBP family glutamic-type intramembrane protease [Planctomycetota bacterium]
MRRTLWVMIAELVAIFALTAIGIDVGNAGEDEIGELLDSGFAHALFIGVVLAPILEELICRGLPSFVSDIVLRQKAGQRWILGTSMAAVFASLHNLSWTDGPNMIALGPQLWFYLSLPIQQFMMGLLQWDFVRRYGLWACILSHALHNFVFMSVAFYVPGEK